MDDSRNNDTPEDTQEDASVADRRKDFTRRALLRAGWVAPLVTAVNIPSAFAQSPSPPHADHADHTDLPHTDTPPHSDVPHTDHQDAPHQDHQDHADSHVDAHVDTHSDGPGHVDVPHVDGTLRPR